MTTGQVADSCSSRHMCRNQQAARHVHQCLLQRMLHLNMLRDSSQVLQKCRSLRLALAYCTPYLC